MSSLVSLYVSTLRRLDGVTSYFESLGIPLPGIQAPFVSGLEAVCGVLLVLGLGTRLVALPLLVAMAVAFATAHAGNVGPVVEASGFFSLDAFSAFFDETPVPYAFAFLVILFAGPGRASLDHALFGKRSPRVD